MAQNTNRMQSKNKAQNVWKTTARLAGRLHGQRVRLTVVAVSIVIYVALSIYNPLYSAKVIDLLWNNVQAAWKNGTPFVITWDHMGRELFQLTVQYFFTWIFYYLQSYLMANVAETLTCTLRTEISCKLNRLPLRFFDRNKAGEILSRVTSDLDKIAEVLQTGLLKLIVAIGTIVGSLIVMFMYSVPLTLIFLLFMLIAIVVTNTVARKSLESATARQETIGVLTGIAEEYYKGRDVIKAYNHEQQSIEQVRKAAEENRIANQKADFLTNCVNPLIRLLTRIAHVVIAVVAGKAMLEGRMTVGVVQAFFQYVNQTAEPMTEASYMINSLQSALASAEPTFELLDEEEVVPDKETPAVVDRAEGHIAFNHVSFGYDPGKLLMKDISFHAEPGQKIAVVGSTGAGKTTLINLLMRFYEINGGSQSRQGGLLHPHHAKRLRHSAGQRGFQPVRGTEAASYHCQSIPVQSAHSDPGRGHIQRGHPDRGGDRKGHEKTDERPDQLRHRAQTVHHP